MPSKYKKKMVQDYLHRHFALDLQYIAYIPIPFARSIIHTLYCTSLKLYSIIYHTRYVSDLWCFFCAPCSVQDHDFFFSFTYLPRWQHVSSNVLRKKAAICITAVLLMVQKSGDQQLEYIYIHIYTYIKPGKYWNIYDINWWSPDFWTINYTYNKLLTPWVPSRTWRLQTVWTSKVAKQPQFTCEWKVPGALVSQWSGIYVHRTISLWKCSIYVCILQHSVCVCAIDFFLGGHDIYCVCCKNFILPGTFGMGLFGLYSMPTDEHLEYEYNGQSWDEEQKKKHGHGEQKTYTPFLCLCPKAYIVIRQANQWTYMFFSKTSQCLCMFLSCNGIPLNFNSVCFPPPKKKNGTFCSPSASC